ncbi:MAG: hypothetical protein AAF633_28360 [Chloroflexota bacterium]
MSEVLKNNVWKVSALIMVLAGLMLAAVSASARFDQELVTNGQLTGSVVKEVNGKGRFSGSSGYYNFRGVSGTWFHVKDFQHVDMPGDNRAYVEMRAKSASGTVKASLYVGDDAGIWRYVGTYDIGEREQFVYGFAPIRSGVNKGMLRFHSDGQLRVSHWKISPKGPNQPTVTAIPLP